MLGQLKEQKQVLEARQKEAEAATVVDFAGMIMALQKEIALALEAEEYFRGLCYLCR